MIFINDIKIDKIHIFVSDNNDYGEKSKKWAFQEPLSIRFQGLFRKT